VFTTSTDPSTDQITDGATGQGGTSPAPPAGCGYSRLIVKCDVNWTRRTVTGVPTPQPARPTLIPQSRPAWHRASWAAPRILDVSSV